MRRGLLVAVLVALGVLAVWQCGTREAVAPRPPVALPSPPPTRPHPPPALADTPPRQLPGQPVPAAIVERLRTAHTALLAAADPCWDDPGPPETLADRPDATVQRIRVGYRLVVEAGQARAVDVAALDSTISDPRMDACLLGRITAARWPSPGADLATAVNDVIILGDLARRRRSRGPL